MSTWTTTREQTQAAAQKANDAYGLARKCQEQLAGLQARLDALEADNARLTAEQPTKRRVSAKDR